MMRQTRHAIDARHDSGLCREVDLAAISRGESTASRWHRFSRLGSHTQPPQFGRSHVAPRRST